MFVRRSRTDAFLPAEVALNAGQYIQWHDLFVIVDDGMLPAAEYGSIERVMREQASRFPRGIVDLCILPPETRPPSDDVKRVVKDLLVSMSPLLSCLAYVVEGTGFKGVAARASLVGMKLFASPSYPIYVETSVRDVLPKVLPHLVGDGQSTPDLKMLMNLISSARKSRMSPLPTTRPVSDVTTK